MTPTDFRWIGWNLDHSTKHGCKVHDIEYVVRNAGRGFPRRLDKEKWLVNGREPSGRTIKVIYLLDDDDTTAFVIHAMPLTTRRRRR